MNPISDPKNTKRRKLTIDRETLVLDTLVALVRDGLRLEDRRSGGLWGWFGRSRERRLAAAIAHASESIDRGKLPNGPAWSRFALRSSQERSRQLGN